MGLEAFVYSQIALQYITKILSFHFIILKRVEQTGGGKYVHSS